MKPIIALPIIALPVTLIALLLTASCRSEPAPATTLLPSTATVVTSSGLPDATSAAAPLATPTATPTAIATAPPEDDITLALGPAVTTTITATSGFTATLPPRWQPVAFGDELLLAALVDEESLSAQDLRAMVENEGEQTEFVALLLDDVALTEAERDLTSVPSLHVLRLPATGLLLADYAQSVASMVQASGAHVRANELRDDLRPDDELSATLVFARSNQQVVQVAFLDAPPFGERDDLIVLTLVAPGERFEELLPVVAGIAASVGLAE